jgi:hypothetical protein
MPTDAQLRANRANSKRSTGPRTVHGKKRASANSLRHGACSAAALLPGESAAEYRAHQQRYLTLYKPGNSTERFIVDRMTLAAWRLDRLDGLEIRVISAHNDTSIGRCEWTGDFLTTIKGLMGHDESSAPPPPAPSADPVALAYIRDSERGNTVTKLARYQSALERSYYLALREWERLKKIGFVS